MENGYWLEELHKKLTSSGVPVEELIACTPLSPQPLDLKGEKHYDIHLATTREMAGSRSNIARAKERLATLVVGNNESAPSPLYETSGYQNFRGSQASLRLAYGSKFFRMNPFGSNNPVLRGCDYFSSQLVVNGVAAEKISEAAAFFGADFCLSLGETITLGTSARELFLEDPEGTNLGIHLVKEETLKQQRVGYEHSPEDCVAYLAEVVSKNYRILRT